MDGYKHRIADEILQKKLSAKGAVVIEGPKWCGKTTTAEQCANSILYMDEPENLSNNMRLAEISPKTLLIGDNPRLIDEWQLAPKLWDTIRFEVDHRHEQGLFILTGSAVPPKTDDIHHSGTGRFTWITMRPMSLFESGESNGQVSLESLFDKEKDIEGINPLSIDDVAYLACRGGWPLASTMSGESALEQAFDYYDAVVRYDISRADNIERNQERVKLLMRSYARNQGTQASMKTLCNDMRTNDKDSLDEDTVASYVKALKKIFVIEDSMAWNPNLRSKSAVRTSDTRYFVDPSIGTAALGIGPKDLIFDLKTFGFIFETMCIRDLRVYAERLGGAVYHYRDSSNLECDAVIHLRNGAYGLIEIKLGGDTAINDGIETLTELKNAIDTNRMKEPSFLMVLTATGQYAFRDKSGIYIVPIGCLRY